MSFRLIERRFRIARNGANRSILLTHLRVEAVLQPNNVGMRILDQLPHDLQLSILEALVLQDLLDRDNFPRLDDCRLEDYSEGSVPDDPLGAVRYGLLPRQTRLGRGRRRSRGGPGNGPGNCPCGLVLVQPLLRAAATLGGGRRLGSAPRLRRRGPGLRLCDFCYFPRLPLDRESESARIIGFALQTVSRQNQKSAPMERFFDHTGYFKPAPSQTSGD